jgi:uncharacterized protein (TIGR03437 family)
VELTLGGRPVQIVSLVEGVGDYPFPGVYELTSVVPAGIETGWQAGTVTVGGVTWNPPNDTGYQIFVSDGSPITSTDYTIQFSVAPDSRNRTVPTGSFTYIESVPVFTDFVVQWGGLTFDLTGDANNGGLAGGIENPPACLAGKSGAAASFAVLSGDCDTLGQVWWGNRGVGEGGASLQMATQYLAPIVWLLGDFADDNWPNSVPISEGDGLGAWTVSEFVSGTSTPAIAEGGIVLGSLLPSVATVSPLSIISLFGTDFSTETLLFPDLDEAGKLATMLGGTCVEIGGERSPVFAITPTQANVQTPGTPTMGPVSVVVITDCDTPAAAIRPAVALTPARSRALAPAPQAISSAVAMVTVEEATPGFFLFPPLADDGYIAARFNGTPDQAPVPVAPADLYPNDDYGPSRPAMPGDILLLYGTGWGPTTANLGTGELAPGAAQVLPEANPMVTFGGVPMAVEDVLYVGVTPGTAGLFQLAIRVPAGAAPGNNEVVLTVYGKSTPTGPVIPVGTL